jgi:hypothetical protein
MLLPLLCAPFVNYLAATLSVSKFSLADITRKRLFLLVYMCASVLSTFVLLSSNYRQVLEFLGRWFVSVFLTYIVLWDAGIKGDAIDATEVFFSTHLVVTFYTLVKL